MHLIEGDSAGHLIADKGDDSITLITHNQQGHFVPQKSLVP